MRFDPSKLLVDPRAAAIAGHVIWDESLTARPDSGSPTSDTAAFVPRSVVVDPAFDWQDDCLPEISYNFV